MKDIDKLLKDNFLARFDGRIKLSYALDYIVTNASHKISEINIGEFERECESKIHKFISNNYLTLYSPDTYLIIELDSIENTFDEYTVPENWLDLFTDPASLNRIIRKLALEKFVPTFYTSEEERLKRKNNPYHYSCLSERLTLETWSQEEGLLILASIDPLGADVNWDGYENYMGVHIDSVKLINATLLEDDGDHYDLPHDLSEEEAKDKWKFDDDFIRHLQDRQEKIRRYSAKLSHVKKTWDASYFKEERYSPKHYIEWAKSKNIGISWLEWAIENKLLDPVVETVDNELGETEKENFLKTIAVLAKTIANDHGTKFKKGKSPNISAITNYVMEQNGNALHGLKKSSLSDRISKGLKLLEEAKKK